MSLTQSQIPNIYMRMSCVTVYEVHATLIAFVHMHTYQLSDAPIVFYCVCI